MDNRGRSEMGEGQPLDEAMGFHELKNYVNLAHMEEQCDQILAFLERATDTTYAQAPVRGPGLDYMLLRHPPDANQEPPEGGEDRIELAIWEQWDMNRREPFLRNMCRFVKSRQVPLSGTGDHGWGPIDLVGVSLAWLPVVIELKAADANDTPLRLWLEASAYAVAIRKAWNEGYFARAWAEHVGFGPPLLNIVPIICAAPWGYWEARFGKPGVVPRAVPDGAWRSFARLVRALSLMGFPAFFTKFTVSEATEQTRGLPLIGTQERVYIRG
jgi:hypothetical protein